MRPVDRHREAHHSRSHSPWESFHKLERKEQEKKKEKETDCCFPSRVCFSLVVPLGCFCLLACFARVRACVRACVSDHASAIEPSPTDQPDEGNEKRGAENGPHDRKGSDASDVDREQLGQTDEPREPRAKERTNE